MPDLQALTNDLKGMPDQALQRELVQPSGAVPSYLVLAEAQRRQTMRQAAQRSQQQSGTVYDDVIRSMTARQPPQGLPPAPPGMTPPASAPPSGGLGTPPGNFRPPNPMTMAAGGFVSDYDPIIESAAKDEQVDPDELRAMMGQESGGIPNAVSPKGARGLMQLMPGTAKDLGVTDINDPEQNIRAGARYYRQMRDKYGGNRRMALAAYNAGPGAVDKYRGIPPFKETQNYVIQVENRLKKRKGFLQGRPDLLPKGPMTFGTVPADQPDADIPPMPHRERPAEPAVEESAGDDARQEAPPEAPENVPSDVPVDQIPAVNALAPTIAPEPPATPAPPAAAPAPAPAYQPSVAETYHADKLDQSDIRKEVEQLKAMYAKQARPNFWQMLSDFGFGMAASPSPFFGVQVGAGGLAMNKALATRQEEARKAQLDLLGVDVRLDDQARLHQEKLEQIHERAVQQAEQHQRAAFTSASRLPGFISGASNESHPGYTFVPNPDNPQLSGWAPPGMQKVDSATAKFMGVNPATGQPYKEGDMAPTRDWIAGNTKATSVAQHKAGLKTDQQTAAAVAQFFDEHPELPKPQNPDGTAKSPDSLVLTDVPAGSIPEVNYRMMLAKGMTRSKAEQMKVDPKASATQQQMADAFIDFDNKQAGAKTGATTTARIKATEAATPEFDLNPITRVTSTGINYVDGTNYTGKEGAPVKAAASKAGLPYLNKEQAFDINEIEKARQNQAAFANQILPLLPRDASGRLIQGPLNKLSAYLQTNPALAASFKDYIGPAIQQLRALAGSKGLRMTKDEINRVFANDVPQLDDTLDVALQKLNDIGRFLHIAERQVLPPFVGQVRTESNGKKIRVTKIYPNGRYDGEEVQQ